MQFISNEGGDSSSINSRGVSKNEGKVMGRKRREGKASGAGSSESGTLSQDVSKRLSPVTPGTDWPSPKGYVMFVSQLCVRSVRNRLSTTS